jgi:hypothetical protein
MDAKFHKLAPLIALKYHPKLRAFLVCDEFTAEQVSTIATYPDLIDHDNLAQTAEIHHAHSYKLEMQHGILKWIDGDCLKTIEGLCAFTVDAWREYEKVSAWPLAWMVRYALAKMTHYRIDALTYPHLHRGEPWSHYHANFEAHMDRWITRHHEELGPFEFIPYKHVYKECRQGALDTWERGRELVERLEAHKPPSDQDCLMAARSCIQGVGDLWLTLSIQMGIE